MKRWWIKNAIIVNRGNSILGGVLVAGDTIEKVLPQGMEPDKPYEVIDARGAYLLPGVIDEHVHFREPGLTRKADIATESAAAVAGGVTSVMDMPNTSPQTTTLEALESKFELFAEKSLVNYSLYFGATNRNTNLLAHLDKHKVCGVKLFMGASTGNMLVDNPDSLYRIFSGTDLLIATHCEDQGLIRANTAECRRQYGDDPPVRLHPTIRSSQACYNSTAVAVGLAKQTGARLHVMHVSSELELGLFSDAPLCDKRITAEVCVPHLLFCQEDYDTLGSYVKCNPAVKSLEDRQALRNAVCRGFLDTIATDHAPHLSAEKRGGALTAKSGMPMIQFSLPAMLELVDKGVFTIARVVEKMCHAPALIYHVYKRGFIEQGYKADFVLVRPGKTWTVTQEVILSKCGWSPLQGHTFNWKVEKTFVNGALAYDSGFVDTRTCGEALAFYRD